MTVHCEQSMKREDQQDATIRCLLLTSLSTCFGHHYAHLQEIKGPVTAFGVLFWFCWLWLVPVVGRCLAGCGHYEGFCSTELHSVSSLYCIAILSTDHFIQSEPSTNSLLRNIFCHPVKKNVLQVCHNFRPSTRI